MTTTKEQAKEKIRKLLALAARPGTPAEGERAMERAQALAAKHGLTIRKAVRRPKPTGRIVFDFSNMEDWFAQYEQQVDREAAERAAQAHAEARAKAAKKAASERKRKETRATNAYYAGWSAYEAGMGLWENPFEREKVFGVATRALWNRGWQDARVGRDDPETALFDYLT